MQVEKVSEGGDFLKVKYVREHRITELKIDDARSFELVTFEGKDGKPPQEKLQCQVIYNGKTKDDPGKWTMNNKSRNALIDAWGNNTDEWVNKPIPITIAGEGEMSYIMVDSMRIE